MFVRFRKLPCDGLRPNGASFQSPRIMCRGPWPVAACRDHCHMKPRCRWRIGQDEQLAPYRLKVILVENKRVNGKVRQETIAVLGSIDAVLLPEFWENIGQKTAAKLKAEDWELQSLRARTAFWKGANRRLKRLANRLGPETKRVRMKAHARVPWPKEPERKRLKLLEAKADFDFFRDHASWLQKNIATHEKIIKRTKLDLAKDKERAHEHALASAAVAANLAKLSAGN